MQTFLTKQEKKLPFINYIIFTAVIILGLYIGNSIAEAGKVRVRVIALFLPLILLWVLNLSNVGRLRLLLVAILLVPLQMPMMPFRVSVSELLLIVLACLQIPVFQLAKRQKNTFKIKHYLVLLLFILFALSGLITAILYGRLEIWHVFCVIPLLWMYVAMNLVYNPEDAFKLIKAVVIGVLICIAIVRLANITGHVAIDSTMGWRMGTQLIIMGPIEYRFYANTFAIFIALGFIASSMLVLQTYRTVFINLFYALIILICAWCLISSGSRGGNIAAIIGTILMLSLNPKTLFKRSSLKYFALIIIMVLLIWHFRAFFYDHFIMQIGRFGKLSEGFSAINTFQTRMLYLGFAIDDVKHNPLGYGFGYMWNAYGYDDAIVYVYLLEGTGILGTIFFGFIVVLMFIHFVHNVISKRSEKQKHLASLGIGTLALGLLAGISSESIMVNPLHSFVFWAILAICFAGTQGKLELPKNNDKT